MQDYTQDPMFKQAYEEYVNAFLAYSTGLVPYPTAQRERLKEVWKLLSGDKDHPN